jgi:Glycosyltransferase
MKKIALVVHRYGLDVNGGAEYHCRVLAEHLTAQYEVDVLTSCARNTLPWDNAYAEGVEIIHRVNVRRFPLEKFRDDILFDELSKKVGRGEKDVEEEWIAQMGPYCPSFLSYLKENADRYEAVIFFTYAFYLTVKGMGLHLKNSILLPTAHDDASVRLPIYREVFAAPAAILYNSVEEKAFITENFHTKGKPSRLTCVGIDIPEKNVYALPDCIEPYRENYIVYVGRISNGKNFGELNRDFIEYKRRNPSSLKLVVVGRTDDKMMLTYSEDIIYAGFVTEEEKTAVLQNAKLLVMPSEYESLSLVILESMAAGRPVLVNGRCAVLKGQCLRSNAGLYYTDFFEFEAGLNYILSSEEEYRQMCENGYRFVRDYYSWDKVITDICGLIGELKSRTGMEA